MKIEKKELKYKEISLNEFINYQYLHPGLGRAEFTFCMQYKYGVLKKVFIDALQQRRKDSGKWVLDLDEYKIKVFSIESWSHLTDSPRIWRQMYCKEHKAFYNEVYVPNNTCKIRFRVHFGDTLSILME